MMRMHEFSFGSSAISRRCVAPLLLEAALMLGMLMSVSALSKESPPEDFIRISWLSRCESHDSDLYFFVDLFPDGVLRYEGVTDVKTLGSREAQLDTRSARGLRSAVRDFLAGKANAERDYSGARFCVRVQVFKGGKSVDSQSQLIQTDKIPKALQRINEIASPMKWACPARLSSTKSGSKSARYCDWQAFTLTVVGRTVCDPLRHVEVYLDGSVYIATYIPRGDRSTAHGFYEIDPTEVAKLVDLINTFEATGIRASEESTRLTYRRSRPEDIEKLKGRLTELTGEKWTYPEVKCDEPSTIASEVSLRRDLDKAARTGTQR